MTTFDDYRELYPEPLSPPTNPWQLQRAQPFSSHCNWTRTRHHLVHKRTLNHQAKLASLAKSLSFRLLTKWLWVRVQLQSPKLQISRLL